MTSIRLLLCILVLIGAPVHAQPIAPPIAGTMPKTITFHGETTVDSYFWLREKDNPEVVAYLQAENAYTDEMSKPFLALQDTMYREILSRTKQTDVEVPYRQGGFFYYTRTEEGKQYPIYCRKFGKIDTTEEVVLDLNDLARGKRFMGLGAYEPSDNGALLLYAIDTTGFREYVPHLRDLRTGRELPAPVARVASAAWSGDTTALFYVTEDVSKRPFRLYRYTLATGKSDMLYEEKDELYRILVSRTKDDAFVLLTSYSTTTTEVRFLRSGDHAGSFTLLLPREEHHRYYVDHRDSLFYIRTNKGARDFRIVTAPVSHPSPGSWREFLPHQPGRRIERLDLFAGHAVITERENALVNLRVYTIASRSFHVIDFIEPVYAVAVWNDHEFNTRRFLYEYQSFVTPTSVYEYDMDRRKKKLLKETEVPGGYDRMLYISERLYAKAPDGTGIPISLVYRKGFRRDGSAALLLYSYGAYGASVSPSFSAARLSLLDRGTVYAIAHIRGGGDLGERWHEEGKMLSKKNTFTDFIACADHLIGAKYTSRDRLAIDGRSAGGLLIGAVLNMRPDLCRAAHLGVPFVDVLNTMSDPSLPLTVQEYLEWGNPGNRAEYEYMKTYCPYTNIARTQYPDMLITTSFNDSQVMYWEPAKYTAKMRALRTDHNMLLLKTNMAGGHGGSSGRYDTFRERAFIYAFLLNKLGISK
jgi:oligopeptidase B